MTLSTNWLIWMEAMFLRQKGLLDLFLVEKDWVAVKGFRGVY